MTLSEPIFYATQKAIVFVAAASSTAQHTVDIVVVTPCLSLSLYISLSTTIMSEPDELYTLRAQFWLGHYQLALEEARSIARRPMSPALKAEREEFAARALIALGQYDRVTSTESPGECVM